ncbi:MAG TPA: TraR/DksA family transcriptional regulator [Sporichthyaceae bacterium]|jgi:DnaK suppressor protein|nr:TraR/DksA family transcriptional regulator [Sporichthyaceae bacterium]
MADDVAAVLAAKRAELEAELTRLALPTSEPSGISFGKRIGEGTSVAVDRLSQVAAHDRLQEVLADVLRAQEKLEEDTYGTCDRCGGPIGPERLDALPWATRCVVCAAKRD